MVGTSVSPFRWGINVSQAVRLPTGFTLAEVVASRSQPDWTYNATHPAQYWSGESENGTVFMLVSVNLVEVQAC